ncbi:MAG TPA: MnhB domain-containing protein [Thermomicrobiales bacterium]|nr:MnhB domain-containing protein [Thermomicrobiales bacterium]
MPSRDPKATAGMLASGARILFLPCWVIAIGVMLQGYGDVGDGFSAGVIAALGVLLQGLAFGADELDRMAVSRYAPVLTFVGLGIALVTVFLPLVFGQDLMTHWPGMNHHAITFGSLEFITPVVFDIGVFLIVYGFCVGGVHAVAREEVRLIRMRERLRVQRERRRREAGEEGR